MTERHPSGSSSPLQEAARLVWAFVRLPLVLLAMFELRHPILNFVEQRFDIVFVTEYVIDVLSTVTTRGIYVLVFASLLLVWLRLTRRWHPVLSYFSALLLAAIVLYYVHGATGTYRRFALPTAVLLATNLLPTEALQLLQRFKRAWNVFFASAVGLAEIAFFRPFITWALAPRLLDRFRRLAGGPGVLAYAPGVLMAIGVDATVIKGSSLVEWERWLRMPSSARVVDRGDINWIELDSSGRYLYVTGHGLERVRRYDVTNFDAPFLEADVRTGWAQGLAYDAGLREIYVFNAETEQLLYLDADSLAFKRQVPVVDVSPGDSWIAVNAHADAIVLASEADVPTGTPMAVVARTNGEVVDRQPIESGVLLPHPRKPLLYLSFFRRGNQLLLYDLNERRVVLEAPADERAERMVFWEKANEILLTSPTMSRVLRYDADTLEPKGHFNTIFGVRSIALDDARQLLLCGSIATGTVEVIDLNSGAALRKFYLGPWLRTITLNPERGVAYVSSNGALYEAQYAD